MSANRNRQIASSQDRESPSRQPKTLGLILLAAGGFSTWYWYKPLPPEANRAAYSDWEQPSSGDPWTSVELIRPTLDGLPPLSSDLAATEGGDVRGVASETPPLIPVPAYRKNLNELVASEPLPALPQIAPVSQELVESAKAWTPSSAPAERNSAPGNIVSPGLQQEVTASAKWPDQNFQYPTELATKSTVGSAPPLLTTFSSAHQRVLRPQDYESPEATSQNSSTESHMNSSEATKNRIDTNSARTPQFIRQPKRN